MSLLTKHTNWISMCVFPHAFAYTNPGLYKRVFSYTSHYVIYDECSRHSTCNCQLYVCSSWCGCLVLTTLPEATKQKYSLATGDIIVHFLSNTESRGRKCSQTEHCNMQLWNHLIKESNRWHTDEDKKQIKKWKTVLATDTSTTKGAHNLIYMHAAK